MRIIQIIIFLLAVSFLVIGCNNRDKFGFSSGNCSEVYNNCLNKCTQTKSRVECLTSCDRSRGMCEAIKTKGCMQDCNKQYGKNNPSTEACKNICIENKGISY